MPASITITHMIKAVNRDSIVVYWIPNLFIASYIRAGNHCGIIDTTILIAMFIPTLPIAANHKSFFIIASAFLPAIIVITPRTNN